MQALWDILTYVRLVGGSASLSPVTDPPEEATASMVEQILGRLYDDVLQRTMMLAEAIVNQRQEQWALDVESQVLHRAVGESMSRIEEVGGGQFGGSLGVMLTPCVCLCLGV